MSDDHLRETCLQSEALFKGRLLEIYRDRVRLPDGKTSTREYTRHPGAVAMVPLLPDGRIMLIRQFRYPLNKVLIEIPAGKLDPGEDYLTTARRELAEEIGYRAGRFTSLGEIDPCAGYSDEHMAILLATDLKPAAEQPDRDEFIEPLPVLPAEAFAMARDGRITDVKTLIGLLWAEPHLQ